jgi:glycine C-acetyltransferase
VSGGETAEPRFWKRRDMTGDTLFRAQAEQSVVELDGTRSRRTDLTDPFDGYFDEPGSACSGRLERGGLLDVPLARRWMRTVDWGVQNDLYTFQQPLEGMSGARVRRGGRSFVMLSSYDYLGLIGHPALAAASVRAVHRHGTGTGGVRLLTGTAELHRELERRISAYIGSAAAMNFSSGYAANIGAISALMGPRDLVVADAYMHRSLRDGCRLAGVEVLSFAHNDPEDLRRTLSRAPSGRRILIVVEGLYSMDGDICPLPDILKIKEEYGAFVLVDEAHSLGVLGRRGRGVTEHFGIAPDAVDVITGSLSKAIPANGGFVAGGRDLIVYLQHSAAPFFFSAALCPAAAGAAKAAIELIEAEPERLAVLASNAAALREGLGDLGFDTGASASPLIPVIAGQDQAAYRMSRELLRLGVVTSAVVYPAVPKGSARLRLCATAGHDAKDIEDVLSAFARLRAGDRHVTRAPRPRAIAASRVEIHEHIDEIDPAVWNSIVEPDDLQASHRFVKACQDSDIEDATYRHVLVYRNGEISAAASLCRMTVDLDALASSPLHSLTAAARRFWPSFLRLPVTFCGLPVSFGQSSLRLAHNADRRAALGTIEGVTREWAEETGCGLICFKEFGSGNRADIDALTDSGYLRLPSLPTCRLPLDWPHFEGFLSSLRAGYRRQARGDEESARAHGLEVRLVEDFGPIAGRLHELYAEVMAHTENKLEHLPRAFFETLNAALGKSARALLVERDNRILASAILLYGPQTVTFLLTGLDQTFNRQFHAYPYLVGSVVAEAIGAGALSLELGQTSYAVKSRYGAHTEPRWIYLRHRSRLLHQVLHASSGLLFPTVDPPQRRVFRRGGMPAVR